VSAVPVYYIVLLSRDVRKACWLKDGEVTVCLYHVRCRYRSGLVSEHRIRLEVGHRFLLLLLVNELIINNVVIVLG